MDSNANIQSTEADHQTRKNIQLDSLINIMARELDDFSQTWDGDPETTPQRFDDLFTLVKTAKAILNIGAME
jgi:hypothetical protein